MVRTKIQVSEIHELAGSNNKRVVLVTKYDPSIPEDQRFSQATPWGRYELLVNNPAALEELKIDSSFFLDFIPAQPAEITINGNQRTTDRSSLSFREIIQLAGVNANATVTYRGRGPEGHLISGGLSEGQSVAVSQGMAFIAVVPLK